MGTPPPSVCSPDSLLQDRQREQRPGISRPLPASRAPARGLGVGRAAVFTFSLGLGRWAVESASVSPPLGPNCRVTGSSSGPLNTGSGTPGSSGSPLPSPRHLQAAGSWGLGRLPEAPHTAAQGSLSPKLHCEVLESHLESQTGAEIHLPSLQEAPPTPSWDPHGLAPHLSLQPLAWAGCLLNDCVWGGGAVAQLRSFWAASDDTSFGLSPNNPAPRTGQMLTERGSGGGKQSDLKSRHCGPCAETEPRASGATQGSAACSCFF